MYYNDSLLWVLEFITTKMRLFTSHLKCCFNMSVNPSCREVFKQNYILETSPIMRLPFLPTELAFTPAPVLEMDPALVLAWSHAGRQKIIHHLLLFPTPDFYFPFSHSTLWPSTYFTLFGEYLPWGNLWFSSSFKSSLKSASTCLPLQNC